jgi:hypothetical protein
MSQVSTLSIKNLLVPSKEIDVEYPGLPGFVVTLCFLSRETLQSIRKKSTKTTFKNRQTVEEVNDELFLKLYVEASIKNWKGLKLSYLAELIPVELGGQDPSNELPFSSDEALALMKASSNFDSFISEQVTDLGNFSKSKSTK